MKRGPVQQFYHVTSRGDRQETVFEADDDRMLFWSTLAEVVGRFSWCCHAYCLMTNHYHRVGETPDSHLSSMTDRLYAFSLSLKVGQIQILAKVEREEGSDRSGDQKGPGQP